MAALALHGLGADGPTASAYLEAYSARLSPLESSPAGYQRQLEIMLRAVRDHGPAAVLARELPELISGWARDAYHPLIRTAYGLEFGIAEEVAAGLAYLAWCGADPTVERLAGAATSANVDAAFAAMARCATAVSPERNFNECLSLVVENPDFATAAVRAPGQLAEVARRALSVFAATGDFFALHLVTGSHAYRTLYPYTGPLRDPIFTLGVLAGYAAVGAPDYTHPTYAHPAAADGNFIEAPADWLPSVQRTDALPNDHDIKLAYSASRLAAELEEPAFIRAAFEYLQGKSGSRF
jgi:hypothetical protein